MANDKLRDLTPVDVGYVPGERPTDEKLEGAEVQTREALEYLEASIGDAFGESLQSDLAYVSNFTRDIGDRSFLNPVMLPSITLTSYVQDLTLGEMEHELDLIPVGVGATIVSSSADSSLVPGQFKNTVTELEVPGDWTILAGLFENGIEKNSRKLVTHSPSSGGTITFAEVTSGRGSAFEGARHNVIPSIAQAQAGGPFLTVSLSDAINNIYTINLPIESLTTDRLYDSATASISNTKSAVGTSQQLKLPTWMFDAAGLDMGSDDTGGGPKTFPLNTIRIYDWQEQKVLDGLLEVQASSTAGNREFEIVCTFRSDIILDTGSGQYLLATNGTSLSEMIGALQRDLYFHKHMGDDMIRGVKHSDLYGLRTGTTSSLDRSDFYGPSSIDNNDHSMYLHRDGYTATDIGGGGNVMRGDIIVGSRDLGSSVDHEHFNLLDDSYDVAFGKDADGGKIYFDKVRVHNLPEGRGNIPQNFSDTALVIEGARDDGSTLLNTTLLEGNLRVTSDVVLGTDQTHDVFITGDLYLKNSQIFIPRTTSGLTPETGMTIYSSDENALISWNGLAWVNPNSLGYAAVVGDGTISFGKYNGSDAATLQAAIADAVSQGGGKVKILRGNYSYGSTTVTVPSYVSIEGEGPATIVSATGTGFALDPGSSHSSITAMQIQDAAIAISVDGTEHSFGLLDIHNSTVGIEFKSASDKTSVRTTVSFTNVATKFSVQTTNTGIKKSAVESVGYMQRAFLADAVDKVTDLDKWKLVSGTAAVSYVDDSNSMIGRGHYEITNTGLITFEDYIPVMPEAGAGGYLGMYADAGATVTVGFQAYDADLALLTSNGGFIKNSYALGTSWEFLQDICLHEGTIDLNKFPIGTRFIRASIEVTANSGTVYFDGFNIFPMSFATIALYS